MRDIKREREGKKGGRGIKITWRGQWRGKTKTMKHTTVINDQKKKQNVNDKKKNRNMNERRKFDDQEINRK